MNCGIMWHYCRQYTLLRSALCLFTAFLQGTLGEGLFISLAFCRSAAARRIQCSSLIATGLEADAFHACFAFRGDLAKIEHTIRLACFVNGPLE